MIEEYRTEQKVTWRTNVDGRYIDWKVAPPGEELLRRMGVAVNVNNVVLRMVELDDTITVLVQRGESDDD